MRVIAGTLGGQTFAAPNGHRTHPMSEKVRGALFNSLGDISDLEVLDAFAGSGALAIEALSRGCTSALAIDSDSRAQLSIKANSAALHIAGKLKLITSSAAAWLKRTDTTFDIVLCDPPYDAIQENLLTQLAERAKIYGIVLFSLPPGKKITLGVSYDLLSHKSYGDATLWFYRRLK